MIHSMGMLPLLQGIVYSPVDAHTVFGIFGFRLHRVVPGVFDILPVPDSTLVRLRAAC